MTEQNADARSVVRPMRKNDERRHDDDRFGRCESEAVPDNSCFKNLIASTAGMMRSSRNLGI